MRTGAMVLGIIGGIIGLIIGIVTWTMGDLVNWIGGGAFLALRGFLVFAFAVAGLVGGAITKGKPLPAGILMLVSSVGGFITIGWFWLFCSILLLIGGILAIVDRK